MVIKWSKRMWLVLAAALLLQPATGSAYSNLYVLGDSLSDTGNLYTATGSLPQAPYANGRFSDGPIYAEHLWQSMGLAGNLLASNLGGTNYAVGGARSRYHSFDTLNPLFNPLTDASSYFGFSLLGQRDAILAKQGGALDSKALYTVWSGSNDVADAISLWVTSAADALALVYQAASDFISVVASLVAAGAQYLLIPNVPNLGLVPEVVALGADAQDLATQLAQLYNGLVAQALVGVPADITGLDTFSFLGNMVADPSRFGLPADAIVDTGCFTGYVGVPGDVCADPQNYVFWDQLHPTAVVHEELGRLAVAAIPEPATWLLMASAVLALAYRRRRVAPAVRNALAVR